MFNLQYQEGKKQQLQAKANANLQEYINNGFKMVREAQDIDERIKEIDQTIAENTPKEVPVEPKVKK